jgi:hypothetical protein
MDRKNRQASTRPRHGMTESERHMDGFAMSFYFDWMIGNDERCFSSQLMN